MTNHTKPTQRDRVLQYMRDFGSITQLDALREFSCTRLASRILELRRQGYAIKRVMREGRNRYDEITRFAAYSLEDDRVG